MGSDAKKSSTDVRRRIEDAKKFGRDWAILADYEKPKDAPVTSGEYKKWREK